MRQRALKENRVDDAREDVILKRRDIYERETRPILEFYTSGLIAEVDAMGSPAAILQCVLENVVPVQEAHFKNPVSGEIADAAV